MTGGERGMSNEAGTRCVELMHLDGSGLDLAQPRDDVRGLTVVDLTGLRLGEVEDLVIDAHDQRARLLSVVSGGILGLVITRQLIPVEAVMRIDDRVHVGRAPRDVAEHPKPDEHTSTRADRSVRSARPVFAAAYDAYGISPYWRAGGAAAYFHTR